MRRASVITEVGAATGLYIKKGSVAPEVLLLAPDLAVNDIATIETNLGAKAAPRL